MKPGFLEVMPPREATAFLAVKHCAMRLPRTIRLGKDKEGKFDLSPHILSRAIEAAFPPLLHVDGIYSNSVDHSWVKTPSGHYIDVMNEGIGSGPIVVLFSQPTTPTYKHYRALDQNEVESEHGRRYGKRFEEIAFVLAVDKTARLLRKIARQHNEEFLRKKSKFAQAAKMQELIAS